MLDDALSLNKENRLVACLWHQGECDAYENAVLNKTPEEIKSLYIGHLTEFIKNLRKKYGDVTFLAGGFAEEWSALYKAETDAVISAANAILPNTGSA